MSAPNPYAPPGDDGPARQADRDATWALVLGIASLVFCAPITAPLTVWKGMRAFRGGHTVKPIVGLCFAALGVLTSMIFWFLAIWQFLSPASPTPSR